MSHLNVAWCWAVGVAVVLMVSIGAAFLALAGEGLLALLLAIATVLWTGGWLEERYLDRAQDVWCGASRGNWEDSDGAL